MKKQYSITKPTDFLLIINEIIDWYKKTTKTNLVITLSGDLGTGKTTFTQELGKVLGVKESITSPTFTIMKQYKLVNPEFDYLIHIDAYRIEDEEEVVPLRIEEVLKQPNIIVCVEWPEQISSVLPKDAVSVSITIKKREVRFVEVDFGID